MARKEQGDSHKLILALGVVLGIIAVLAGQEILEAPAAPPQLPIEGRTASVGVVAVAAETGEGIVGSATIEVVPGRGRTLISTNPFIEPDTQDSVQMARAAAEKVTGISASDIDIIATFELPGEAGNGGVVGGPSAGLPVALALVSALSDKPLTTGVVATGTIDADGSVGPVGGVIEKAEAAGRAGNRLFLVPKGQGNITYYEKEVETERLNGFVVRRISYVPRTLDLGNYTQQWDMAALEVENLWEAAEAAIPGANLTERGAGARVTGAVVCGVLHSTGA